MLNDERRKQFRRKLRSVKKLILFSCSCMLVCGAHTLRPDDLDGSFHRMSRLREHFRRYRRESCKNAIRSLSSSLRLVLMNSTHSCYHLKTHTDEPGLRVHQQARNKGTNYEFCEDTHA